MLLYLLVKYMMHLFAKSFVILQKFIQLFAQWLMENGIIYLSQGFCCLAFSVSYLNMFYFAAFKGRDTLNDQLDITQFEEISEVFMPELPKEVIKSYVDTGESM